MKPSQLLQDVENLPTSPAQRAIIHWLASQMDGLEALSVSQLETLDAKAQEVFHDLLLSSAPGNHRELLFRAAYSVVPAVLLARRKLLAGNNYGFGIGPATVDRVLRFLGKRKSRVIDIGCSNGFLVAQLLEHGHDAFGVELSEQLVESGRQRLGELGHARTRLVCSDFLHLDAGTMSDLANADLIWSNDVLEHLHPDEVRDFFERAMRLLAPGGVLWLITPSRLTQTDRKTLHLKQYYLSELLGMASSAGFSRSHARLLGSRRRYLWPMNVPSPVFCSAKVAIEPLLRKLPRFAKVRVARSMAYSEVFLLR